MVNNIDQIDNEILQVLYLNSCDEPLSPSKIKHLMPSQAKEKVVEFHLKELMQTGFIEQKEENVLVHNVVGGSSLGNFSGSHYVYSIKSRGVKYIRNGGIDYSDEEKNKVDYKINSFVKLCIQNSDISKSYINEIVSEVKRAKENGDEDEVFSKILEECRAVCVDKGVDASFAALLTVFKNVIA